MRVIEVEDVHVVCCRCVPSTCPVPIANTTKAGSVPVVSFLLTALPLHGKAQPSAPVASQPSHTPLLSCGDVAPITSHLPATASPSTLQRHSLSLSFALPSPSLPSRCPSLLLPCLLPFSRSRRHRLLYQCLYLLSLSSSFSMPKSRREKPIALTATKKATRVIKDRLLSSLRSSLSLYSLPLCPPLPLPTEQSTEGAERGVGLFSLLSW